MYVNSKKDCPRGFIRKKDKCVPEGTDVSDKLVLKYERYFFKEDKEMEKCKPDYRWCPVQKKCVPKDDIKGQGRGEHRGQGKGPMGNPMKEAGDLVDVAFDEGFEIFGKLSKARKKVEKLLDSLEKTKQDPDMINYGQGTSLTGRPYDHPKKIRVVADVEECGGAGMMGRENGVESDDVEDDSFKNLDAGDTDEGPNEIPHEPIQGELGYKQIRKQLGEALMSEDDSLIIEFFTHLLSKLRNTPADRLVEFHNLNEGDKAAYREYFKKMLKKFGVNSPAELDDNKKKEFFNAVDKGWKGEKESD